MPKTYVNAFRFNPFDTKSFWPFLFPVWVIIQMPKRASATKPCESQIFQVGPMLATGSMEPCAALRPSQNIGVAVGQA